MIPVNVSGRFKVLDQPYVAPSKCAFCGLGHNQDGKVSFVDTTLDLDFYGVVYICSNCLMEIAESLGYVGREVWGDIKTALDDKLNMIDILKAENDGLRDAVNILTGHRCITSEPRVADILVVENNDPETISEPPKGVESAESKPDPSSGESGLSDVRGIAKLKSAKSTVKPDPGTDIFDL